MDEVLRKVLQQVLKERWLNQLSFLESNFDSDLPILKKLAYTFLWNINIGTTFHISKYATDDVSFVQHMHL